MKPIVRPSFPPNVRGEITCCGGKKSGTTHCKHLVKAFGRNEAVY